MLANLMTAAAGYAVQRGIAVDLVAEAADMEPHALIAAPERVPEHSVSRVLDLLSDHFPDEPVGVAMAASTPLHFLGPFEAMARLAPDLREGVDLFVRFRSVLSTNAVLELVEEPPGPLLRLDHPNDRVFGPQSAEMGLTMGVRAIDEVLGVPDAVRTVWFAHPPTAPIDRYSEFFSVPLRFDAPYNAVLLRADRLDAPVDPDAGARLRVVRAHLELVRRRLDEQGDPPELQPIRDAATQNAARGEFSASALARLLGMSVRTLQRRVDDLGTSVSAVIDDVREATARQLMSDPDLTLLDIALSLGYSGESTFRRAFRRWTGQSPATYRREQFRARR
ncbi:MAG: AraC family transcriptional regulator ligand-binding domain-containing protein [Actinomycetota bacterium]